MPPYDHDTSEPRSKKVRTTSRGTSSASREDNYVDNAEDEDVDIDGDGEDTRFLPDPSPPVSHPQSPGPSTTRRLSNIAASSSQSRTKDKDAKSSKSNRSSGKKRRAVVWTDDEDEELNNPNVVITDDDNDFNPDPELPNRKGGIKGKGSKAPGKAGGRGASGKKEDKEIIFRDERKVAQQPNADPLKRVKDDESVRATPDPLDEPIPKRRKLPPIKKNKPSGSTSTGPPIPAFAKPTTATSAKKEEPAPAATLTPAPTSNQVGVRKPVGASTDLNLLDSSVYSELFMRTVCYDTTCVLGNHTDVIHISREVQPQTQG